MAGQECSSCRTVVAVARLVCSGRLRNQDTTPPHPPRHPELFVARLAGWRQIKERERDPTRPAIINICWASDRRNDLNYQGNVDISNEILGINPARVS